MLRRHFTNVVNNNSNNEGGVDLTLPYVTFEAQAANSTIGLAKKQVKHTLEYSYDTITWNSMAKSTIITLVNIGDKVYIRGKTGRTAFSSSTYTQFTMTGLISARGNCNAIWSYTNLNAAKAQTYRGYRMFCDCVSLTTAPELPSPILTSYCYYQMFYNCTSLVTAPVLPAITASSYSYYQMFYNCTNLNYIKCLTMYFGTNSTNGWLSNVDSIGTFVKHADAVNWKSGTSGIPDTWVIEECELKHHFMTFVAKEDNSTIGLVSNRTRFLKYSFDKIHFDNFTDTITLNKGQEVYMYGYTSSNTNDYYTQFTITGNVEAKGNCGAIWNTYNPNLLDTYCGYCLFKNCVGLTVAPELPVGMATNCYSAMFLGCTNLTSAPVLTAATIYNHSYQRMFENCTSLNYVKCLATDISYEYCVHEWLSDVAQEGVFVKHPDMNDWPTGTSGIPEGWTIIDAEI